MKICIISNSHAASLKNGWESIKSLYPNLELTFFATPNRGMAKVRPVNGENRFVSHDSLIRERLSYTSGGLESIDVDNYDSFLVHGLFLILPRLDRRLSQAVKEASIEETIRKSMNYRFVSELCGMTKVPVYYSANPLLSDEFSEDSILAAKYHSFNEISEWIAAGYSHFPVKNISQPSETVDENYMCTKRAYSVGSVRLKLQEDNDRHAETDVRHMNTEFGAVFLKRSFIPELVSHGQLQKAA